MGELNATEAIYGFVAWLSSREDATYISANHEVSSCINLIERFKKINNLPDISKQWPNNLTHPPN